MMLETANVTSSMKEFIVFNFKELMMCGGDKDMDTLRWLTGKGAGIYSKDKSETKKIEGNMHRMTLQKAFQVQNNWRNRNEEYVALDEFTESLVRKGLEMAGRWRNQFLQYYGDEP
ncbi:MAG: hypothetical protein A3C22_02555 [Candidatus Levybacteria bacterium RIFCSPHIGHO2_02_FULL_37_10]|nr:MAG: hypothetical protein A3C22_02555 [Candidatus Levybacteria bacterium RIFCSPHIGHO2_02_FULL_37_10]